MAAVCTVVSSGEERAKVVKQHPVPWETVGWEGSIITGPSDYLLPISQIRLVNEVRRTAHIPGKSSRQ
ncbi:hypothetical protein A6R68_07909 [Neotoma lepida]|uniref:Uncharacterized protein n=1 Tax=Neotoma lepida TaxID=56216 RepID=A0A1A6GB87_NEOLE|nr:hypothetical protein A6R68_07909 [Neotoma lepida]